MLDDINPTLRVICPGADPIQELPLRACQYHRDQGHERCDKSYFPFEDKPACQQWRYAFKKGGNYVKTTVAQRKQQVEG